MRLNQSIFTLSPLPILNLFFLLFLFSHFVSIQLFRAQSYNKSFRKDWRKSTLAFFDAIQKQQQQTKTNMAQQGAPNRQREGLLLSLRIQPPANIETSRNGASVSNNMNNSSLLPESITMAPFTDIRYETESSSDMNFSQELRESGCNIQDLLKDSSVDSDSEINEIIDNLSDDQNSEEINQGVTNALIDSGFQCATEEHQTAVQTSLEDNVSGLFHQYDDDKGDEEEQAPIEDEDEDEPDQSD